MNGYEDYSAAGFPHLLASRRTVIAGLASASILSASRTQAAADVSAEDERFMRLAIDEARLGDLPFGAVTVRDGEVIARGRNLGKTDGDPTAHAEMVAIRCGRHALHLGRALRDVYGRDHLVPYEPDGLCRLRAATCNQEQSDHDLERRNRRQSAVRADHDHRRRAG